ncbi:MAG: hypothetical protein IJK77_06765 [Lachnospiraceae bacterium]|nr:hypothetical protein [Lachnospiraceae bacterium]
MAEEVKKKKVVEAAGETKKTVAKAADETKKAAKKVEEAAETVSGKKKTEAAKPVGNAKGLRIGAVILWVAAIAFELVAVFTLFGKINITFMNTLTFLIILIVLDLICVIIGSQLWKKANHIDPASKKNKTKFWLWNNMGLIVAIFAFVPLIILLLTNKNLDKKTQTIAVIAACAALLIGGAASIDYNPVSAEEKQVAEANISGKVTWTQYGKVYHIYIDDETWCQHLNNSDTVKVGTVEEAIAAGKTRLCKTCAHNHGLDGIEDLPLGGD